MPLLDDVATTKQTPVLPEADIQAEIFQRPFPPRKQSLAKTVIMNKVTSLSSDERQNTHKEGNKSLPLQRMDDRLSAPHPSPRQNNGNGAALTDTPANTAPNSPRM